MKGAFRSFILVLSLLQFVYSCSKDNAVPEPTARIQYTLTVTASEGGSVSPENTTTYSGKTVVTITAIPDEGYEFARWLGTDNDNKPNPCGKGRQLGKIFSDCHITIEMNSNRDVQVFFKLSTLE
jgi:hypothetical protein